MEYKVEDGHPYLIRQTAAGFHPRLRNTRPHAAAGSQSRGRWAGRFPLVRHGPWIVIDRWGDCEEPCLAGGRPRVSTRGCEARDHVQPRDRNPAVVGPVMVERPLSNKLRHVGKNMHG